jgi:hypothetical protein
MITHAAFSARCANIASIASSWSRDFLMAPSDLRAPIDRASGERFLRELRSMLDNLEKELLP